MAVAAAEAAVQELQSLLDAKAEEEEGSRGLLTEGAAWTRHTGREVTGAVKRGSRVVYSSSDARHEGMSKGARIGTDWMEWKFEALSVA